MKERLKKLVGRGKAMMLQMGLFHRYLSAAESHPLNRDISCTLLKVNFFLRIDKVTINLYLIRYLRVYGKRILLPENFSICDADER